MQILAPLKFAAIAVSEPNKPYKELFTLSGDGRYEVRELHLTLTKRHADQYKALAQLSGDVDSENPVKTVVVKRFVRISPQRKQYLWQSYPALAIAVGRPIQQKTTCFERVLSPEERQSEPCKSLSPEARSKCLFEKRINAGEFVIGQAHQNTPNIYHFDQLFPNAKRYIRDRKSDGTWKPVQYIPPKRKPLELKEQQKVSAMYRQLYLLLSEASLSPHQKKRFFDPLNAFLSETDRKLLDRRTHGAARFLIRTLHMVRYHLGSFNGQPVEVDSPTPFDFQI